MNDMEARKQVCWAARQMYKEGLVRMSQGNVSCRLSGDRMAITPSGMPYDEMSPEDIVICDLMGNRLEGSRAPSSEVPMHAAVLRSLPETGAVVHTHSPYAVGFAICRMPIPSYTAEAGHFLRGPIHVAPFATPGSAELGQVIVETLKHSGRGVLMANHGVLAVGPTVEDAYRAALTVETTAQAAFNGMQIGKPVLPE